MAKQRWQRIEGPSTVFSTARAGQGSWLVGTEQGVWRYQPGQNGSGCEILSEALRPAAITAVAASPAFPDQAIVLAGAADGIARTTDLGQTWAGASMPQSVQISQIAVAPNFTSDGRAYAATLQDGVLCSSDHGASWMAWNFGLLDMETLALAVSPSFARNETVVTATVTGLFRSTNGGHAWRELPPPRESVPLSGVAFAGDLLIAGSETQGLLYSPDGGATWARRSSFRSGQVNAVAASPDGRRIALATPTVVALSTDQGLNWDRTEGHTPEGIICLSVSDDGLILCGTQEQGLWAH